MLSKFLQIKNFGGRKVKSSYFTVIEKVRFWYNLSRQSYDFIDSAIHIWFFSSIYLQD